jgi:hypothetical protein
VPYGSGVGKSDQPRVDLAKLDELAKSDGVFELLDLILDEVSLVDRGAGVGVTIELTKQAKLASPKRGHPAERKVTKMDEFLGMTLADIMANPEALAMLTAYLASKPEAPVEAEAPVDENVAATKALQASLRSELAKLERMRKELDAEKIVDAKYSHVAVERKVLIDAIVKGDATTLALLDAHEALAKTSGLFTRAGITTKSTAEGGSFAKLKTIAEDYIRTGKANKSNAFALAGQDNPELWAASQREGRG